MTISAENSDVQQAATQDELYYDPYSVDLNMDPYAVFARIREEAPLYYNDKHDFYALSRFDDVNRALINHETFISGRGALLEIIKSGMEIPPGTLIFEDPPLHNIQRNLLSRMFTPTQGTRPGTADPRVHCPVPGPVDGYRSIRFRQRPRRADADAGDRDAAGHSGRDISAGWPTTEKPRWRAKKST